MPKARSGNFTLRKIATGVPEAQAAHRFTALQRSGQYSELRFIQRGKSSFDIVGYKWPDKGARRKLNIGRARINPWTVTQTARDKFRKALATQEMQSRWDGLTVKQQNSIILQLGRHGTFRWPTKNPNQYGGTTPNQVLFGMRGRTVVGWINRETPTRYEITYKVGAQTRTVWRNKDKVKFQRSGKYGTKIPVSRNNCPKAANPSALQAAAKLSADFHGFKPRNMRRIRISWPKALTSLGQCARVDYISDKWDEKTRRYFHEFEQDAVILAAPNSQPDGDGLLIIKGKFKIKPEGITG